MPIMETHREKKVNLSRRELLPCGTPRRKAVKYE